MKMYSFLICIPKLKNNTLGNISKVPEGCFGKLFKDVNVSPIIISSLQIVEIKTGKIFLCYQLSLHILLLFISNLFISLFYDYSDVFGRKTLLQIGA